MFLYLLCFIRFLLSVESVAEVIIHYSLYVPVWYSNSYVCSLFNQYSETDRWVLCAQRRSACSYSEPGGRTLMLGENLMSPSRAAGNRGLLRLALLLPTLGLFTVRSFQTKLLLSRWWLGINKSMQSHQLQCYFIWIKVLNRQAG